MEKYTTSSIISSITDVNLKKEEEKKVILGNDAYAICDFLDKLSKLAEGLRIALAK